MSLQVNTAWSVDMEYLSLKYTIPYMKRYILASVIPSRISAKLNYRISANSFRGNYNFLEVGSAASIQGRKLLFS